MSAPIEASIEIAAPREVVFDFVQDPAQRASWDEGVISAERRGEELGIRYRVFGPITCEIVFVYTLLDRPKRSAVKMVRSSGPCVFESAGGAWFYESVGGGTRFTTRFSFETRWIPAALVRSSLERATRRSLARLKSRIEGSRS